MGCKSIFITGCNRPNGLGFGMVKQLLENWKPEHLFASCRNPAEAKELHALTNAHPNLHVVQLDITDHSQYEAVVALVDETTGGQGLNMLINNSGTIDGKGDNTLANLTIEAIRNQLEVNLLGPMFLTKAFLPLLEKAASKSKASPVGVKKAAVVNVSTKMASIADNTSGGRYCYRTSKCALNMATKSLSFELLPKGILTLLVHPGWVRTDLGGPNGLISTEESVASILGFLEKSGSGDNGKFVNYDGKEIAW